MRVGGKRGRPPSSPPPDDTTKNDNYSSSNNYLSFSESLDSGNGGNGRGKKKTSQCCCWVCRDSLGDEIKSIQKSISHTKQDTDTILNKMKKLEAYFLK